MKKLLGLMASGGPEALVVSKGSDIRYLTGFSGEYGTAALIVSQAASCLVTDSRFEAQAAEEVGEAASVHVYRSEAGHPASLFTCVGDLLRALDVARAGVVAADISLAEHDDLVEHAAGVDIGRVEDYVASVRMIKDEDELAVIKRACQISMRSFYAVLDVIRPGVSEIEVANELEHQFRSRGGEGSCFETIVASGPRNGACPHASVSDRNLEYGDFVTIDFGTSYKGYCSDITRTVVIGTPKEPELVRLWGIVERAKELGASMLRPGVPYAEISNAIGAYVAERGHAIPHGVGHNLGLDIHEPPFMGPRTAVCEQSGMVHTIEPGIYVSGLGGVRQEDDYLITDEGCERLTYITDHLIEL